MRDQEQEPAEQAPPSAEDSAQDAFGLLKVSGLDAKKFLQGQLTCNVEEVTATSSRLGAHCNPEGRVLFLFRIFYAVDAYYLLMPRELVPLALKLLKKYAIFFKLSLTDESLTQAPLLKTQAALEWAQLDLRQGVAKIYLLTSGKFLPHDLKLHELAGLSWEKGCYTGQEIIARMHYRGKLKNQLYRATIETATQPERGAEVYYAADQGLVVGGYLVDYLKEEGYNNRYQLLVLTTEANQQHCFKLDPTQNETWEWFK